jgi:hypothetical protein
MHSPLYPALLEMGSLKLPAWLILNLCILLISASQVVMITGMSHHHLAKIVYFE